MCDSQSSSTSLSTLNIVSSFNFSQACGCVVVFYYGFQMYCWWLILLITFSYAYLQFVHSFLYRVCSYFCPIIFFNAFFPIDMLETF